jgi:methylmalonyl-CoA mutase N-terminal domain/subunit
LPKSKIRKALDVWRAKRLADSVKRKESFRTSSDIELKDVYAPDAEQLDPKHYLEHLGFPGEFPYTRGVYPTMYRGRPWTMRQYAGFGTAEEANKRYLYLLSQGTTGLSVAFDLPTQMGRDSDHALSSGEVGRVGVAIDTLEDMEILLKDIPLDKVSTSMTINSTAHILLALYLAVARKRAVGWDKLRGTVQNDVLKEYIARGTYIYPPEGALKIATDIFEFCKDEAPLWNTISVSGYHIREAGSTAVQEVAFTLADGIAYVQAAVDRGLQVDEFAPRVAFFFNCHNNFLEEAAKFRAARRVWARIMRERFKAKSEKSCMLRFHTQTAGSTLTAQQPMVNIARTTVQALAAVLGGTQSLHTNAYDEALCLPTEESARIALRTQQVLLHESGLTDVVDPLGGSYAIESLTDEIEAKVRELLAAIEERGGMVRAIEAGYPQKEIEEAAYQYQKALERGEQKVVGVNVYAEAAEQGDAGDSLSLLKVDPGVERDQRERLAQTKSKRDHVKVDAALEGLRKAAAEGRNLMPSVIESVQELATLGEISDVLRAIFGEYRHQNSSLL